MVNSVCKILGNNIKRIRNSKNITQNMLAELLEIEVKSLSLIETGKGFATAKTIENLCRVLDVSVAELFDAPSSGSNASIYSKIMKQIKLIKNNKQKLEALEIILKGLV